MQTVSKQHSIRCTKDGRWTEEFHMCKNIEGECLPPPDINLVEQMCDDGFSIGQYACIKDTLPVTTHLFILFLVLSFILRQD